MGFFWRLFYCVVLLSLLGCQGMRQNVLKEREVAQCYMTCTQHFEVCRNNCIDNCPACSTASQTSAARDFEKYVHERKAEGKKVMRELNSYRDPLQCRKVTCDCLSDLTVCKQSCAGVIPKKLQTVPNCI
ncbi:acyltransferase [Legionella sainthelensi]|uniref:Acyltransferase n=1 Tax=Legionella sainthelensi TaxID=28087 RepID=A0A2H5FMX0_9GAMM|nr:acyltransferase [Legionella sainthelensi]AUH72908.1 acyltransferase [Legionella sainthelensi]